MFNILCVTNRRLCCEDFLKRIEKIADCRPAGIILREKDLTEADYEELAKEVIKICEKRDVLAIPHKFANIALKLNFKALHLPLDALRLLSAGDKKKFSVLGASCHSLDDALEAENLGCTYITLGHIFDTDCKKGLPGRGIAFLKEICGNVSVPVYAIGGITPENIGLIKEAGAAGACVMSSVMTAEDVKGYLGNL
ncbi:MAG: thiamine phosphate synthase [Selenomonadaceae bacterium]|nr:thiamine phosphate synthase [Selenomonadaceae bacterium]